MLNICNVQLLQPKQLQVCIDRPNQIGESLAYYKTDSLLMSCPRVNVVECLRALSVKLTYCIPYILPYKPSHA